MRVLLQRLMGLLPLRLAVRQKRLALQLVRIKAATYYVKGVKAVRGAFVGYVGLKCVLGLFAFGVTLVHIGFFLYVPWSLQVRALVMLSLGGVYTLVSGGILVFFLRERWWMKQTGANEIVEAAVQGDRQHRSC